MNCTVIHYNEIFLKGKNKVYFENKLISNLKKIFPNFSIEKRENRLILSSFNKKIKKRLRLFPGIAYFAPCIECNLDIETIKNTSLTLVKHEETFKIETKRSNKQYELTSMEVNEVVGEYIVKKKDINVDLDDPDLTVYIEICRGRAYIYNEKIRGVGGLPVGTGGTVVSLLSGGIDSPVASYLLMKRGASVISIHFLNESIATHGVEEKVEQLIEQLTTVQLHSKLYLIPFGELQREIVQYVPSKYRMIVYRRTMIKIANMIAEKEGAQGIVTGDSLSQVASQTIENLNVIYHASTLPILTPLMGMNKNEIISTARDIGTYKISILPHQDCCSFMIADHPELRADLQEIVELESRINTELLQKAVEYADMREFKDDDI